MPDGIALLCTVHPASEEKKDRVLTLLKRSLPWYRSVRSKCTAWTYFVPTQRHSSSRSPPANYLPSGARLDRAAARTALAGFEVYTDKSALQAQLEDREFFQAYHAAVREQALYARAEELVAWYSTAGFLARGAVSGGSGRGVVVVVVARATVREGKMEPALGAIGAFAEWVRDNEPETLSYAVFTRPKAPREVLVVERYTSAEAFEAHKATAEFGKTFTRLGPLLEGMFLGEFDEVDGSFVGNVVGGDSSSDRSTKVKL